MKKIFLSMLIILMLTSCSTLQKNNTNDTLNKIPLNSSTTINAEKDHIQEIKIEGEIYGKLIKLLPDYVFDDKTPRKALVSLYQEGIFLINIDLQQLENLPAEGSNYKFTIDNKKIPANFSNLIKNNYKFFQDLPAKELLTFLNNELFISDFEEIYPDTARENKIVLQLYCTK